MPAIVFDEIILILVYSEGMEYLDIYKHIVEWANPEEFQRNATKSWGVIVERRITDSWSKTEKRFQSSDKNISLLTKLLGG